MPEVKVERDKPLVRREAPGVRDFFAPMFPIGRYFGMNPFGLMREFSTELDKMFQGAGGPESSVWAPTVDVHQVNGNLIVTAELPGLKQEEVKVEMTGEALILEGERKREHKEDHEGFHRYERSYGRFYRSIPLPEGAKADQTKADLNNGVLKVTIPVPETKAQTRRIPVGEGTK
jgi:HSP20 family protein